MHHENTILKYLILLILTATLNYNCTDKNNSSNKNLVDAFKPLESTWQSRFYIYEDSLGQREGEAQPKNISYDYLRSFPIKLKSVIEAMYIYKSENPSLQKGEILDSYLSINGTIKTVKSKAINKIENAELKCIVTKPNKTVIHDSEYLGDNTIRWHRKLNNPLKIKYFRETVVLP